VAPPASPKPAAVAAPGPSPAAAPFAFGDPLGPVSRFAVGIADRGEGLPPGVRSEFEPRFGRDLAFVRVHTDAAAVDATRHLRTPAFALGRHLAFAPDGPAPETPVGRQVLAHELTHALQDPDPAPRGPLVLGARGDSAELEASSAAAAALRPAQGPIPIESHPSGRTIRAFNGGGAPAPTPTLTPSPAPAPGVTPPSTTPPPTTTGGPPSVLPVPTTVTPAVPPASSASSASELVLPPVTLFEQKEWSLPIFTLPLFDVALWDTVIELPPPFFAATAEIRARAGLTLDLFLRAGPGVIRDIRLTADPSASRYTGTAQLYLPVAFGPRATLQGSLLGRLAWLGLVDVLTVEGGIRAIGQAPVIVAWAPAIRLIYDSGSMTFTLRDQIEAAIALLFDLEAFAEAKLLGDKVWGKKWNLYHWQWGRAVRFGSNWNLDYVGGHLAPPRVEPFAERMSVEEVLQGLRDPAKQGGLAVITPGRTPMDRLRDMLGQEGADPHALIATIAEATPAERAAIRADPALTGALQGAVGSALWPLAERILNNTPSETTPSLSEGAVFLANRHIASGRFQDALHVIVSELQSRGIIDGTLARIEYVRSTTPNDEGLTTTHYSVGPSGERTPTGPSAVRIYDSAFVNVPWLYSSIMHEYQHVLQHQTVVSAAEWTDPDRSNRREIEAYLWEIEHARGSGVIASPTQMQDIGRRLTDHFNAVTPRTQAMYRTRYDAAMRLVHDVASGRLPVSLTFSIASARRTVQESSAQIAEKVRERAATTNPARQAAIDREIEVMERARSEALVEVVLADNPNAQVVDAARGIYRAPVTNGAGRVEWVFGSISVVWHITSLLPDVFAIGVAIRAHPPAHLPPGVTMGTPELVVGGSGVQSSVQPHPGDIDFGEEFHIAAPTTAAAGAALADTVADFVRRNETNPSVEFVYMRIMPVGVPAIIWSRTAILDPALRSRLATNLAGVDAGKINTFWRVLLVDGRFVEVTKVLGVDVVSSTTGAPLMATTWMGARFQEAYLEDAPPGIEHVTLGEYAETMRRLAIDAATKHSYLKAAKRAFNYFRAIGNLEAMSAIQPVFVTTQAQLNQNVSEVETISAALDPAAPTRILTVDVARRRLEKAAAAVVTWMPALPGHRPPAAVAADLTRIAAALRGTGGPLAPDGAQQADLTKLKNEIADAIGLSLEARVQPIIDRYVL
jgi:hypothetical protein